MSRLVMAVLLLGLVVFSVAPAANAAHVVIIESTSINPTHLMDQNWANVAVGMGHTFSLLPQTALDTGSFMATCDLLIISSGVIPLSVIRQNTIRQTYNFGIPVYLQTEADPTLDTSQLWVDLVTDAAGTFSWTGNTLGTLSPMRVTGTSSFSPNPVNQVNGFLDGAFGTGSREVETLFHYGAQEFGWYVRPLVTGSITLAATTSDQEWVNTFTNTQLMENFISNLLALNATELQVRVMNPNPPITIPAAGGAFTFQAYAYNTSPLPVTFDAWTMIELPNGNLTGPYLFLTGLTMPGYATSAVQNLNQFVPGFAPPGTYYLQGTVGQWSVNRRNLDALTFTKL